MRIYAAFPRSMYASFSPASRAAIQNDAKCKTPLHASLFPFVSRSTLGMPIFICLVYSGKLGPTDDSQQLMRNSELKGFEQGCRKRIQNVFTIFLKGFRPLSRQSFIHSSAAARVSPCYPAHLRPGSCPGEIPGNSHWELRSWSEDSD